jgi:hypothetical protein
VRSILNCESKRQLAPYQEVKLCKIFYINNH